MALFATLPSGFTDAVDITAHLDPAHLANLARDVVAVQHGERETVPLKRHAQFANVPETSMECVAAALHFIFSEAQRSEASREALEGALVSLGAFSDEAAASLASEFSPKLGRLVGLDWTLSVIADSSFTNDTDVPCVTVTAKVSDNNGNITAHTFEMTLPEFENFKTEIDNMSEVLEAL